MTEHEVRAIKAQHKRAERRLSGTCVNGCGPAEIGCRCAYCAAVHGGYASRVSRLYRELARIAHA